MHAALPGDAEASRLLALMLLTDARRPARTDAVGELVPLADQDRRSWDRAKIAEGRRSLARPRADPDAGPVGEYHLQAAIAAVHDQAATADDTDWRQILALYELLEQLTGNPVVTHQPRRRRRDGWTARPPAWRCSTTSTRPCRRTTAP